MDCIVITLPSGKRERLWLLFSGGAAMVETDHLYDRILRHMATYCKFSRGEMDLDESPSMKAGRRAASRTELWILQMQRAIKVSQTSATLVTLDAAVEYMQRRWTELKPIVEALRRSGDTIAR